jgi:hypothetical protein
MIKANMPYVKLTGVIAISMILDWLIGGDISIAGVAFGVACCAYIAAVTP